MARRLATATTTVTAGLVAGLVGACHPARVGHPRTAADQPVTVAGRLRCPDTVLSLHRVSQAADGRACAYSSGAGELTLALRPLDGRSADDALRALESEAHALTPSAPEGGPPAPPEPPAPPSPPTVEGDHVRLDLPGLHIDADDRGARVKGLGQSVEADDSGAVVRGGPGGRSSVVAKDGGAVIRSGGVGAGSVDATYIAAADAAGPDGWRVAGYVARGPLAGPLVVAQVRSRGEGGHGRGDDGLINAARKVVDINVAR